MYYEEKKNYQVSLYLSVDYSKLEQLFANNALNFNETLHEGSKPDKDVLNRLFTFHHDNKIVVYFM